MASTNGAVGALEPSCKKPYSYKVHTPTWEETTSKLKLEIKLC